MLLSLLLSKFEGSIFYALYGHWKIETFVKGAKKSAEMEITFQYLNTNFEKSAESCEVTMQFA